MAIWLFQRYEKLGKQFWDKYLWGRGYCVGTVGTDETRIREYVQWQENKEREIEK